MYCVSSYRYVPQICKRFYYALFCGSYMLSVAEIQAFSHILQGYFADTAWENQMILISTTL